MTSRGRSRGNLTAGFSPYQLTVGRSLREGSKQLSPPSRIEVVSHKYDNTSNAGSNRQHVSITNCLPRRQQRIQNYRVIGTPLGSDCDHHRCRRTHEFCLEKETGPSAFPGRPYSLKVSLWIFFMPRGGEKCRRFSFKNMHGFEKMIWH